MLTAAQIEVYHRNGYAVLPGFKSAAEIAALRQRALVIVDAFEPGPQRNVFTTDGQSRRSGNADFFASAEGVTCFVEAGTWLCRLKLSYQWAAEIPSARAPSRMARSAWARAVSGRNDAAAA